MLRHHIETVELRAVLSSRYATEAPIHAPVDGELIAEAIIDFAAIDRLRFCACNDGMAQAHPVSVWWGPMRGWRIAERLREVRVTLPASPSAPCARACP